MRYFEIVKPPARHILADLNKETPPEDYAVVG